MRRRAFRGGAVLGLVAVLAAAFGAPGDGARADDPSPAGTKATKPAQSKTAEPSKQTDVSPKKGQKPKMVQVNVFNDQGKLVGPVDSPKVELTDKQWKEKLSPQQFQILRGKGTERAFCGTLLDNKRQGVYACVCCGCRCSPEFQVSLRHRLAEFLSTRGKEQCRRTQGR